MHDVGGLVALAPQRLRGEIGAVGLGQDAVGRHGRGSFAKRRRLRVGHVPRERDVVARARPPSPAAREPRSNGGSRCRGSRPARPPCRRPPPACGSRPGSPSECRDLELAVEERALHIARREIVEVVEPRLTDGDGIRVPEQLDELADPRGVRACRPGAGRSRARRTRPSRRRRSRAPPGRMRFPSRS